MIAAQGGGLARFESPKGCISRLSIILLSPHLRAFNPASISTRQGCATLGSGQECARGNGVRARGLETHKKVGDHVERLSRWSGPYVRTGSQGDSSATRRRPRCPYRPTRSCAHHQPQSWPCSLAMPWTPYLLITSAPDCPSAAGSLSHRHASNPCRKLTVFCSKVLGYIRWLARILMCQENAPLQIGEPEL